MDKEIRLIGRLICTDAAEARLVRELLPEHTRLSREEEGCLQFDVEELPGTTIWEVHERFADKGAFERHQARTKASEWGEKTVHIRREFDIDEVDPEAGPERGALDWPDEEEGAAEETDAADGDAADREA